MWNKEGETETASRSRQRLVYSEPETLTTASSARSLAFFAFFRRLRSLSRCLAFRISFFDRPGLLMSSSYTTVQYYFRWQVKMAFVRPCLTRCVALSFCSASVSAFLGMIHEFPWVYATTGHCSLSCLWTARQDRCL